MPTGYASEQYYLSRIAERSEPKEVIDSSLTGRITVATAGTAVQGADRPNKGGFFLVSHPDNTDTVWIFPWGYGKDSGWPLQPTGSPVFVNVANLNLLGFDADVNGERLCWIKA
ncbi:MAG: hypothetical protein A2W23_05990 [Planctomycetes bacterium RBG_16_43_13]|nr:MAG: hypothetical protein A2W23_05990 [Planctomycetes bacterium RBG_16_43_13]